MYSHHTTRCANFPEEAYGNRNRREAGQRLRLGPGLGMGALFSPVLEATALGFLQLSDMWCGAVRRDLQFPGGAMRRHTQVTWVAVNTPSW